MRCALRAGCQSQTGRKKVRGSFKQGWQLKEVLWAQSIQACGRVGPPSDHLPRLQEHHVTQVGLGSLPPASGNDPQPGHAASEWCCHAGPLFTFCQVTQSVHRKLDKSSRQISLHIHKICDEELPATRITLRARLARARAALAGVAEICRVQEVDLSVPLRWASCTPDNSGRRGSLSLLQSETTFCMCRSFWPTCRQRTGNQFTCNCRASSA